jgi:hypothetical protein
MDLKTLISHIMGPSLFGRTLYWRGLLLSALWLLLLL